MPLNEWPDPQFCIQDANSAFTAINDQLTDTIRPIDVTGNTVGASVVICGAPDTDQLRKGDLVYFNAPADPALRGYALRVVALNPNVSFTVVTDYSAGPPRTSATCTANVLQRGAFRSGSGDVTSNVRRGSGGPFPMVWISDRRAHIALLDSTMRVLVVRKSTDGPETIYWAAPKDRLLSLANTRRAVGLSVYVAGGAGAAATAYFNTGSISDGGSNRASEARRTWISGQIAIPRGPPLYQAGVRLTGPPGATFVLGEFTECASESVLADGSFSTPRAQFVRSMSSISPWVGRALTTPASGGFTLDLQQTSSGIINGGVSILTGLLEGQAQTLGAVLSMSTSSVAPALFNPVLRQLTTGPAGAPSYYAFCGGNFNVASSVLEDPDYPSGVHIYPTLHVFGTQSTPWKYLSWDIHGAVLFAGP